MESLQAVDEKKIASEMRGNTLRAYWALLNSKGGVIGVRELQRSVGFSSSALAAYHLSKLEDLGLAENVRGDYHLIREVRVGVLKQFIRLGTFMLPRYLFYAGMFTSLLIYYATQFEAISFHSLFALIFGVLGTAILWYETQRIWRQKP